MKRSVIRCVVVFVVMSSTHAAWASDEAMLLEAIVNGQQTHLTFPVYRVDESYYASREDLQSAGIRLTRADPERVRLSAIANSINVDVAAQTITIEVPMDRLALTSLRFLGFDKQSVPLAPAANAAVLNYDLVATRSPAGNLLSGFVEGRWSGPDGVFSSTGLAYLGANLTSPVRLDTVYTYSDPATLRRVRLGDYVGGGLTWTRPVRLGGLQLSTDFQLRPDLVTFPTPSFFGEATVPSTVDLFINGVRQLTQSVPPGAFELRQAPVPTGAGSIAVTVTDALGRQSVQTLPFYTTDRLLAKGLSAFSLDTGWVRRDYGQSSNHYGILAGVGTLRHAWNDILTLEAHGELTHGLTQAGVGSVIGLGNIAVLSVSEAASQNDAGTGTGTGHQTSVGIEHSGGGVSLGLSRQMASALYRDLGAVAGSPVPRMATTLNMGMALGGAGSLNVAYGAFQTTGLTVTALPVAGSSIRVLSASYTTTLFARVNMTITGFKNLVRSTNPGSNNGNGVMLSLLLPLDHNRSAIVGSNLLAGVHTTTVQGSQPAISPGDFGWQVQSTQGGYVQRMAELDYKGRAGRVMLAASSDGQTVSERFGMRGAVAATAQGVFASNWIDDSFAIVDTGSMPDVRVFLDNRLVGRTRADGKLMVPDLRSYDVNRVGVDLVDLPLNMLVLAPEQLVRPRDRSASLVDLRVILQRPVQIRLIDAAGMPLAVGSSVTNLATGETVPLGYDGETFFADLAPESVLNVTLPSGNKCTARIQYVTGKDAIVVVGPVSCL